MFKLSQLSAVVLSSCFLLATITPTLVQAKGDTASISFADLLQQERQWAGLQSKTLKVDDVTWRYSEGGSAAKPTIILIHGLSGSRDNWNRVAHYLTPFYHVIIPDLPFHGETQAPADFDTSVPNLTEKLRRFAEAGNFAKDTHIAGHSLGGAIAMLYAAQYFSDTKSLLLMSSAGVYKSANTAYLKDPTLLRDLLVRKSGDLNNLIKLAMGNPPFIPQQIQKQQEDLMISQSQQTQKVVDQLNQVFKAYTPESFALAGRIIEAPALIMWGDQDRIINHEVSQELKSILKFAEPPIIYQGVGHMPLLEMDQVVAKDYLNFLQKLPAKPTPAPTGSP